MINSPFAIWLLSATALSIGGAVFSGIQTCRTDADQSLALYEKLETEAFNRFEHLYLAILEARSIKDVLRSSALKERQEGFTYAEFKGRKLEDLEDEYRRLSFRKFGRIPLFFIERGKQMASSVVGINLFLHGPEGMHFSWYPLDISDFSQATEADLPKMQEMAREEREVLLRVKSRRWDEVPVPLCGVAAVVQRLITGTPTNIMAMKPAERPQIVFPTGKENTNATTQGDVGSLNAPK